MYVCMYVCIYTEIITREWVMLIIWRACTKSHTHARTSVCTRSTCTLDKLTHNNDDSQDMRKHWNCATLASSQSPISVLRDTYTHFFDMFGHSDGFIHVVYASTARRVAHFVMAAESFVPAHALTCVQVCICVSYALHCKSRKRFPARFAYTYTHTYTHTHIHTYIHTHTHTYIRMVQNACSWRLDPLICMLYNCYVCLITASSQANIVHFHYK